MSLKTLSLAVAFLLPVAAAGFSCTAGPMDAAEGRMVIAQRWNLWNDPQGDLVKPDGVTRPQPAKPSVAPPTAEIKPSVEAKPPAGAPMNARKTSVADNVAAPDASKEAPAAKPDVAPRGTVADAAGADYIIGIGDVLDISVWKDEALTKSVIVLPDGKISFPLIGKVEAAGKMVSQLREELESKLARWVTDLVLSVDVRQINSMTIYVIGRVHAPGRFALNGNVSVLQALAIAGGFTPFANRDKVKIFRQDGDKTKVLPFRYSDVADGKKLEENIMLHRGDVIVVP
jgi:polysaccharide export outer membrane protein